MESHKLPIRSVVLSENDGLMATSSFDCVKLWAVDFSSQNKHLKLRCSHNIDIVNALSILIVTGNKYIVIGTKEGTILLYELATNELI